MPAQPEARIAFPVAPASPRVTATRRHVDVQELRSAIERAGGADRQERIDDLESKLGDALRPLARVAYNYVWSWLPDGEAVFREINPLRWAMTGGNPVRFLSDLWPSTIEHAESDERLRERIVRLAAAHDARRDLDVRDRPDRRGALDGRPLERRVDDGNPDADGESAGDSSSGGQPEPDHAPDEGEHRRHPAIIARTADGGMPH